MVIKKNIENALRKINTPGSDMDIVSKKLVENISASDDGMVSFIFRPLSPICPRAFKLASDIKKTVKKVEGVRSVDIKVVEYQRADELMGMLNDND